MNAAIRQRIPVERLTDVQRRASLDCALNNAPSPEDIQVFAYGSMMWNPLFKPMGQRVARLAGFRRSFCVWSQVSRGTPKVPGLALGLEKLDGAFCWGIVFRLNPDTVKTDLEATWRRELYTAIYQPQWLEVKTERGDVRAIAFTVDPNHPQYAPSLDLKETAAIITRAVGENGPCLDYLESTARELAAIGCMDSHIVALQALVEEQNATSGT